MKATKLIELLSQEIAKASLAGYSDVEVQITSESPRCGQCVDVARVIFAEEVDDEEDDETGEFVEKSTGNKAIFLTEGGEPETNRYNFLDRERN